MTTGEAKNAAREKNTAWARRQREQAKTAKNMDATRCRVLLARGRPCRTPLQSRFVNGETLPWCPTCDRKARGVCVRCGEHPVYGQVRKAIYCTLCRKLASLEALQRHRKTHARSLRAKERRRMADPVVRADRLAYKKLYRKAMPKKIAAYKRAGAHHGTEQGRAYHAAYRARHAEARRERERLRNAGLLPPRSCLTCPTILTGRAKRCDACKRADQVMARALIAERMERAA